MDSSSSACTSSTSLEDDAVFEPRGEGLEESHLPTQKDSLSRFRSLPIIVEDQSEPEETIRTHPKTSISHDKNLDTFHRDGGFDAGLSLERPPNIDFYRSTIQKHARPSMPELMHGISSAARLKVPEKERLSSSDSRLDAQVEAQMEEMPLKKTQNEARYMGWFKGVYIPAFTNIVGTLLYLRMGYVVGQAGIVAGCGVVLFSTFLILITALSLTGICSNGQPRKGGLYYVVSRALGPQLGGCIGVIFSIANIGMAALYIVGIAEFTLDLLTENGYDFITANYVTDNRVISLAICVVIMLITFAGPQIEDSFTLFFFSTYFVSYFNWLLGTVLPVSEDQAVRGITGYSLATAELNLWPNYRDGENVVSVFAVFFPGFTGMMAATMYVDQLRDPGKDVAAGLFSCIGTTTVMYIIGVFSAGFTMVRDANGVDPPVLDNLTGLWEQPACVEDFSCKYGLMNYHQVAEAQCAWVPLIILGMFGMTISSTMTNLDQGPLIFQAICKDNLFPYLDYFAKEYGPNKEPRRAYLFFGVLTMGLCLIGDLNELNFVVTAMFMVTYALVNYACFDASFAKSPGWRPTFPYYNMWVSLFGAAMCVVVMFVISIYYSVATLILFSLTMAYFHYYRPEVNWGDSNQAHVFKNALTSLHKLTTTEIHVKNYRPQILLMIGNPASRVPLLDFANCITKGDSLLLAAHVMPYAVNDNFLHTQAQLTTFLEQWLKMNKIKAFYTSVASGRLRTGAQSFLQTSGLGKLRPNVLMIGFKEDWSRLDRARVKDIDEYVGILHDAFEANYGVGVLRTGEAGFDHSEVLMELRESDPSLQILKHDACGDDADLMETLMMIRRASDDSHQHLHLPLHKFHADKWMFEQVKADPGPDKSETRLSVYLKNSLPGSIRSNFHAGGVKLGAPRTAKSCPGEAEETGASNVVFSLDGDQDEDNEAGCEQSEGVDRLKIEEAKEKIERMSELREKLSTQLNRFHSKVKRGRIDIYWLYDDGGLTLLIPHLLRMPKSYLEGAELRIFTLASSQAVVEADEENMVAMLTKFRIEFSAVKVIQDISTKPRSSTLREFEAAIKKWKAANNVDGDVPGLISDAALAAQKKRTMRQLRTREILVQNSRHSDLIVITLPIPRPDIPNILYLAWLDVMTKGLPPTLMIRGNQTSVLSFYL